MGTARNGLKHFQGKTGVDGFEGKKGVFGTFLWGQEQLAGLLKKCLLSSSGVSSLKEIDEY